ncbi:unnamed protein product [marine sediment metagenome]|uniref:Uncharacterized protein n=2 Tax=marine sediment metagenome TaxID=412755 RepID=X1KXN6_9ZZZZ
MKNISVQIVEMLFENPLEILEFGKPQSRANMTVIPIIYKGKTLEFISVKEAEELGFEEVGDKGLELKNKVIEITQNFTKIRVLGPNCMGLSTIDGDS